MSEFTQQSFSGGMNLLLDDTRLDRTQYRIGFNLRNRYGSLEPVPKSKLDTIAPAGIKQEMLTFGEYIIVFISGYAWYRHYATTAWAQIESFRMSSTAPRYWTCAVPIATTLYGRLATQTNYSDTEKATSSLNPIISTASTALLQGNTPGLLVQDNVSQPMFIFINQDGYPEARTTQTFSDWDVTYGTDTDDYGIILDDKREYVPIGNAMAYVDGVLYIVAPDKFNLLISVSGRPLDFVINVKADGSAGGDAYTTSYSVGVGNISCIRGMSDGSLFVAAGNSNFAVSKNFTDLAPKIFGEYTFIRKFLFESTCLTDRGIFDSLGDTRFIDLTGVRSFNAIQQLTNEGRNSIFTSTIAAAFKEIVQNKVASILFDGYELYAVNTVFGPAIAVFDTVNGTWVSFDISQTGGKLIKQFAKIELGVQKLYAITEDNSIYSLYSEEDYDTASFMTLGINSSNVYDEQRQTENPRNELKPTEVRVILNRITKNTSLSLQLFIDNRQSLSTPVLLKNIRYKEPSIPYNGNIPDLNTQLTNVYYTLPNLEQGWKVALLFSWSNGALTQFGVTMKDVTPMNPLNSQGVVT